MNRAMMFLKSDKIDIHFGRMRITLYLSGQFWKLRFRLILIRFGVNIFHMRPQLRHTF